MVAARTRCRGGRSAGCAARVPGLGNQVAGAAERRAVDPAHSESRAPRNADEARLPRGDAGEIHGAAVDVDEPLQQRDRALLLRLDGLTSARSAADGAPSAVATMQRTATHRSAERTNRMAEFHRLAWVRPHDTRHSAIPALSMTSASSTARSHFAPAPAVTAEGEALPSAPQRLKYVSVAAPAPGSSVAHRAGRALGAHSAADRSGSHQRLADRRRRWLRHRRHRHGRGDGQGCVGSDRARYVRDPAGARCLRHAYASGSHWPCRVAAGAVPCPGDDVGGARTTWCAS